MKGTVLPNRKSIQSILRRLGRLVLGGVFYKAGIFFLRPEGIYGTLKMERTQVLSKKDKRKLRKRVFHATII